MDIEENDSNARPARSSSDDPPVREDREDHAAPAGQGRPDWLDRNAFLLALGVAVVISFTGIFNHDLRFPDEPRVAAIGREMYRTGDLLVPTLNGEKFIEKPPLHWWAMVVGFRLFGISDGTARLPTALPSFLTLLVVFAMASRVGGRRAGLLAVLATASLSGYWNSSHNCLVDGWLLLFINIGYLGFLRAAFPPQDAREDYRAGPHAGDILLVYLGGGLAFLAKGPVGVVLLVGPIVVASAILREGRVFRSWAHLPGAALFLVLCSLWPLLLHLRGGGLLENYVQHNILYRIAPTEGVEYRGGHVRPFWYYIVAIPGFVAPWLFVLHTVILWVVRECRTGWRDRRASLFLAMLFPLGMVLLSIPATKRILYLWPMLPPLGATVGLWFARTSGGTDETIVDRLTKLLLLIALPGTALVAWTVLVVTNHKGTFPGYPDDVVFSVPGWILAAVTVITVGVAILSVWGGLQWKRGSKAVEPLILGIMVLGFMAVNVMGFRLLDPLQNPHSMTRDIAELRGEGPAVVGYELDEFPQAIMVFDAGGVQNIEDEAEFQEYLLRHPGGTILTFQKSVDALDPAFRKRLEKIGSWRFRKRREYSLFRIRE